MSGPGWAMPIEVRSVDQVKRKEEFVQRHPRVTITSPRENGGREFVASWGADEDFEAVGEKAHHSELRALLDYLEARFDRGDLSK
jgi:hypothetical protein